MDALANIRQTFFQECEEQLIELENGLLAIQGGSDDSETVNAVFRAVHSIKGGAGAFDLADLVHFAHVFENTLDLVRTGKLAPDPTLLKIMLRAADQLADLVIASRDGTGSDKTRSEGILDELTGFLPGGQKTGGKAAPAPAPEPAFEFTPTMVDLADFGDDLALPVQLPRFRIHFKPTADLYAKGNETTILFREVKKLGTMSVICDLGNLPKLEALEPEGAYLEWLIDVETSAGEAAIKEIFDFVEFDSEISIESLDAEPIIPLFDVSEVVPAAAEAAPAAPALHPTDSPEKSQPETPAAKSDGGGEAAHKAAPTQAATIRVDLDRVDRLIDLVGELVINQAMLTERVAELALPRMSAVSIGLDELEQLTREIQDSVMAIRAQPVRSVFQRLPRLVREVAAQTGKSVRLITEGEGTEVDKTVIERLIDPLTHMVRNAIDHGLEKPDVRRAAGKSEEGSLRIAALHRSGRIVIEISDDGAGINRDRVRQKAIEKGLISAEARLTDEEIDNLIFLPGFSTAEQISDISGRGVGMDVVRSSIQALGGRISITSRPGQGSTFTMSLPLTLAVLDGMVVSVANQTLVIPLSAIIEILMPQSIAVHALGASSRVIGIRNGFIPLVDVGRKLNYRTHEADPKTGVVLLVENESGASNALIVDAIQGQRQVVIKSLEANYGAVPGIAAATILGNGRVALILDVDAICMDARSDRMSSNASASAWV